MNATIVFQPDMEHELKYEWTKIDGRWQCYRVVKHWERLPEKDCETVEQVGQIIESILLEGE